MEDLVMTELDRTMKEFSGDPARIYLAGFSMGATGAYRIAYRWPTKFAALTIIAGRLEHGTTYTEAEKTVDLRDNPWISTPDPFSVLAPKLRSVPIWIFHGDADRTVPVEQSRRMVSALKAAHADVRYTEYPGAGHSEAASMGYAEPEMIKWLLSQHR
jgi:predicted peptidase